MNTIDTIIKNIRFLMEQKNVRSVTELAHKVKLNQPTLHRLLAGDVPEPKLALLGTLAHFFKVSISELVEVDLVAASSTGTIKQEVRSMIPIKAHIEATQNNTWGALVEAPRDYLTISNTEFDAYAFRCMSSAFMPRIKAGECIIIEPSRESVPGDEVMVVGNDQRIMLMTLLFERSDEYHLVSITEDQQPVRVPKTDVKLFFISGIHKTRK